MDLPDSKNSSWAATFRLPSVQAMLLALLAFLATAWFQIGPGFVDDGQGGSRLGMQAVGLLDVDGYYHIKMGELYRTGDVQRAGVDFHWARESIWNGQFSDKDYLYHLYLVPFAALLANGPHDAEGLIAAGKAACCVNMVLLTMAVFAALRIMGVRRAWLYTLLMIFFGGGYFVFRVNLNRSYMFSIALALLGYVLIARTTLPHARKGAWLGLFLLSAIYALSYTASHFLLVLLAVRGVLQLLVGAPAGETRLSELRCNLLTAAVIAAGILTGVLLHPDPSAALHHWWVQSIVVMALSHQDSVGRALDEVMRVLFNEQTNYARHIDIALGMELQEMGGRGLVFDNFAALFAPMLLPLFAAWARWRPSREAVLTGGVSIAVLCMFLLNMRFVEYVGPFSALAVGLWMEGVLASRGYQAWQRQAPALSRAAPLALALIAGISVVGFWLGSGLGLRPADRGEIAPAGLWLQQNTQAHGKVVYHDRWDDFCHLLFYASECDYLAGLDPTFFAVKNRERYELWRNINRGKVSDFVPAVRDTFGASYMLIHRSSSDFLYNRAQEEVRAGRLRLCIRDPEDDWALFEVVR
ncbi:hypothetical protein EDM80_05090 [bacterium]|nr:MAG: hypothetical protein EDM80_05090 [bacterium]RIK61818.1 MAG: hypothetical protein DCC64_12275 [Planctomycetota bacterium]